MKLTEQEKKALVPIIKRIKKGDEKAFGEFIEITQKSVFRFCFFLSKNREQADEFCQETYLKAMDHFKNLKNEEASLDWLLKIAKNLFLDYFRSTKRHSEILNENANVFENSSAMPEAALDVRTALSHFDPEDRSLLILIDLENYSYSEAAHTMGLSEDAVRSRIHRIRQNFAKIINNNETK